MNLRAWWAAVKIRAWYDSEVADWWADKRTLPTSTYPYLRPSPYTQEIDITLTTETETEDESEPS